jgi:hypothetical protein
LGREIQIFDCALHLVSLCTYHERLVSLDHLWKAPYQGVWCVSAFQHDKIYLLFTLVCISIPPEIPTRGLRSSCDTGYKISSALSVLGRTAIISEPPHACLTYFVSPGAVAWSARTYAVFGRSRIILAYFTVVGLPCIILHIVNLLVLLDILRQTYQFYRFVSPHSVA